MRLKKMTISGFKSFADKTILSLDGQITSIVGPNGCGKSNVVDALRWVIGESSAKQLRGASMSDVVFNGAGNRSPLAKASVELLLDNSSRKVLGEYAAFNEIAIRREVSLDGQSQYSINGVVARRRDVIDLFLGTGLGSRSYSVIEQGMINQIIEAKPEEMRSHIEEVAGISKYKERRRETANRMQRTNDNMERLNDICQSVDKQLRHLERQAKTAERYQGFKQELTQCQAQFRALGWQSQDLAIQAQQTKLYQHQATLEAQNAALNGHTLEIERSRLEEAGASEAYQAAQKNFYAFDADIARHEQQIAGIKENRSRWSAELEGIAASMGQVGEKKKQQQLLVDQISEFLKGHQPAMEGLSASYKAAQETSSEIKSQLRCIQETWDDNQLSLSESQRTLEVSRAKLEHREREKIQYKDQITRLSSEIVQLESEEFEQSLQKHAQEKNAIEMDLSDSHQKLSHVKDQIRSLRESISASKQSLPPQRRKLADLKANLQALEAIKYAHSDNGLGEKRQHWLTENNLDQHHSLLEDIQVNSGWEVAAEMVLGAFFDAVCAEPIDDFGRWRDSIPAGVTLLKSPQDLANNTYDHNHSWQTLCSQISSPWNAMPSLKGVFIANSREEAMQAIASLAPSESIITQDGLWVSPLWIRQAKVLDNEDTMIARQGKIDALKVQISKENDLLERLESDLETSEVQLTDAQAQAEVFREKEKDLSTRMATVVAKIQSLEQSQRSNHSRCESLKGRQSTLTSKIDEINAQTQDFEATIDSLQHEVLALENKKQSIRDQLDDKTLAYQESEEVLKDSFRAQEKHQLLLSTKTNEKQVVEASLAQLCQQETELEQRRLVLNKQLSHSGEISLEDIEAQLQQMLNQRASSEEVMLKASSDWEGKKNHLHALDLKYKETQGLITELSKEVESFNLKVETLKVRRQTFSEQLEEMGLSAERVLETIDEDICSDELGDAIDKLQSKMNKLGPVNFSAIEDCKSLRERKSYLDTQYQDLSEALVLLDDAIRKIDVETKNKFKSTFDVLNHYFKELFPQVFGGGYAELYLTDDDVLNSGVGIKAQPPGKKNSRIQMLSGGEKAMTAVALVFALFKLNPAPICILDEVDAPLDDANVLRFCDLLKAMAEKVQLIVISHNKITIESSQRLMGVTMSEPGVSRLVSVDVEQAVAIAQ